ncbi:MAG TPA: glycoside-pentoside-hexuronide (GPH):cation symporter, partial [Gemmatimonadaceae bacterium]|nr:glycoside-pentoside-hexuronide (GPH):cation symporter [Gemmatimonadaceae bacterium]
MRQDTSKITVKEKVGYAFGDAAANFVFQTMLVFQLAFYTDTFGITAAAAGTLFLVVRVWDAVFDPIMGVVADRTNTRWGKFRPWILWTAVPFGIVGFLAFTTPPFGPQGKLLYAYVTYIALMMVYSANNLPYSALSGVITGNLTERTSLSAYRFVFAMSAAFLIQGLALPMVNYFGQGNSAKGYQITMGIFSALAVVFFVITFFTTKERVQPDPTQKSSIQQDFADLGRNRPWLAVFALTIFVFITLSMRGGVMVYYFKYFVQREDLFSLFNVCGLAATIVGVVGSTPLAKRFGKRDVFIVGL